MKLDELKAIAIRRGLEPRGLKTKADLVRAIQADEGNSQCFATGAAETCGQDGCLWRPDCR